MWGSSSNIKTVLATRLLLTGVPVRRLPSTRSWREVYAANPFIGKFGRAPMKAQWEPLPAQLNPGHRGTTLRGWSSHGHPNGHRAGASSCRTVCHRIVWHDRRLVPCGRLFATGFLSHNGTAGDGRRQKPGNCQYGYPTSPQIGPSFQVCGNSVAYYSHR